MAAARAPVVLLLGGHGSFGVQGCRRDYWGCDHLGGRGGDYEDQGAGDCPAGNGRVDCSWRRPRARRARVHLGVDGEFLDLLRDQVDPVLARAGFTFNSAFGPCRARPGRSDTFLYEAADPNGNGCIDVWIRRDRFDGKMEVSVDGHRLERLVALSGDPQCATRVTQAEEPVGDVAALVAAFGRVLP